MLLHKPVTILLNIAFILIVFFILPQQAFALEKRIEINLSQQRLYPYQDNQVIYNFLISPGKWQPTPVGTYTIYWKIPSIRMIGGDKDLGTYYDLSNVPFDMFFYQGYAIHGAYWHNNFGYPMSHGCINMRVADSTVIYNWAPEGTEVKIY